MITFIGKLPDGSEPSDDYKKGYEAAWKDAVAAVWQNRNHHRAMDGYAPETPQQAYDRIYTRWPAPRPPRLPNARPLSGTIVDDVVATMLDAIDLYVVLANPDVTHDARREEMG